ncbi:MAG: LysR substrate-binding domain-containing protein [Sneathiellales bacterium]|nr:LysR substrate-binding domain-containing protein [Sneathiellales bacterium]
MPKFSRDPLPPLEWIRSFEAAGRHGNFTAAAKELGLTQAAVSQHIRSLEETLEIRLFRRLPRGVELTVNGEAYLPHIQKALSLIRRGTSDLFGRTDRKVSIAGPASAMSLWVAPRLKKLTTDFPDTEFILSTIHREVDYENHDTDYEIRYGTGDWPDRFAARLYRENLVPAMSPVHVKKLDQQSWQKLPFIAVNGLRDGWREWAANSMETVPKTPHLRFDSFITALEAAKSGAGVILASVPLVQSALKEGSLVLLEEKSHKMTNGAWITWKETLTRDHLHDRVIEVLKRKTG